MSVEDELIGQSGLRKLGVISNKPWSDGYFLSRKAYDAISLALTLRSTNNLDAAEKELAASNQQQTGFIILDKTKAITILSALTDAYATDLWARSRVETARNILADILMR
jgi:hypothetical protein